MNAFYVPDSSLSDPFLRISFASMNMSSEEINMGAQLRSCSKRWVKAFNFEAPRL